MKHLLFFLVSSIAFGQVIETRTIQPNSHVLETKKVKVVSRYISSQDRDKILKKEVPKLIKSWDEVDRDLFYKSIVHYDDARVLGKYPQLDPKSLARLREKFKTR